MSNQATCPTCNGTGSIDAQTAGLAAMLVAARKAAGLTQKELAEATGLNRGTIANVESGRHVVTIKQVRPLAKALGISPEALLP